MERFTKKQFTSRFNRIMVVTFFVVIIVSLLLVTIQTVFNVRNYESQLEQSFNTKALVIDDLVGRVTNHLKLMHVQAESYYLGSPRNERSKLFDALSPIDPREGNPNEYGLDNIPFPHNEESTANLTGIGDIFDMPPALITEIEMSLSLNNLFKATRQNIRDAAWVYYISESKFLTIFPWESSVGNHRFEEAMFDLDFYRIGLPDQNPEKAIRWTDVYKDQFGLGLMVTAVKPVYNDADFLGNVAIDITLDELVEYVGGFGSQEQPLMIINESKQVIAHPTLVGDEIEAPDFVNKLPDALKTLADTLFISKNEEADKIRGVTEKFYSMGGYNYISHRLTNAPWVVFYAEEQNFVSSIFSNSGLVFIVLLGGLVFMLFVMRKVTFREFINPAENLVEHISKESQNMETASPTIPKPWKPWFDEISKTFGQNRNLIKEVNEKNKMLTDMNLSLERYMPKFILVLSFRKNSGGTTIGNYFADTLTRNNPSKNSVYMEFPNPEEIYTEFDIDEDQAINKHPNGYDIWGKFELGHVPDEAKTSLLLTKILDGYNNIVINAILPISEEREEFIDLYLEPMFQYAKAIILLVPPEEIEDSDTLRSISQITKQVRQDQTRIYKLLNKIDNRNIYPAEFDCEIPFLSDTIKLRNESYNVPEAAQVEINKIVNLVERVHQLSIYIPTTIDVNTPIDTDEYVKKTMNFLGEKFGGATSSQAQGVWKGESSGMVDEAVSIVVTHTTEVDLDRYMDDVIDFVKEIKVKLSQEAMAIEINKKMSFV